jgi:hypothetical protein
LEGGDVKAALVGLLGSSHDIKEEYVDSYDDSNSGLLRPHIANTTIKDEPDIAIKDEPDIAVKHESDIAIKDEPDIAIKDEPDIAVKHESDIAIKDEQDIAIKDEPDIAVKQESDTAIKHEPFENKSYLFIVEDPEYSYFVRCDAQYRTLEEGDLWDLESDSEVENAVVGHRGSQQLLDAVARALGARIPGKHCSLFKDRYLLMIDSARPKVLRYIAAEMHTSKSFWHWFGELPQFACKWNQEIYRRSMSRGRCLHGYTPPENWTSCLFPKVEDHVAGLLSPGGQ